jgi:hypothetical protein
MVSKRRGLIKEGHAFYRKGAVNQGGTWDCASYARKVGIPVQDYEHGVALPQPRGSRPQPVQGRLAF